MAEWLKEHAWKTNLVALTNRCQNTSLRNQFSDLPSQDALVVSVKWWKSLSASSSGSETSIKPPSRRVPSPPSHQSSVASRDRCAATQRAGGGRPLVLADSLAFSCGGEIRR